MNHAYEIQTQAKLLYVDRKQAVVDSGKACGTVEETEYKEKEKIFHRTGKCATFCDTNMLARNCQNSLHGARKTCGFHHGIIIQL